jgi:Uma2 family endonuclease
MARLLQTDAEGACATIFPERRLLLNRPTRRRSPKNSNLQMPEMGHKQRPQPTPSSSLCPHHPCKLPVNSGRQAIQRVRIARAGHLHKQRRMTVKDHDSVLPSPKRPPWNKGDADRSKACALGEARLVDANQVVIAVVDFRSAAYGVLSLERRPPFPCRADCYMTAHEAPMNVPSPLRMDKAAFLDWVQGREERYELDRGRAIMLTGGSRAHWQITANLFKALDSRLDPQQLVVLPEFGIDLQSESIRFPDIIVDRAGEAPKDLTATAPVLIAEVLSPSSERVDLGDKSAEYLRLPSLVVYLVFAQEQIKTWVWTRGPAGFPSGPDVLEGDDAVVRIEALGINLPLAEVYARVRMD